MFLLIRTTAVNVYTHTCTYTHIYIKRVQWFPVLFIPPDFYCFRYIFSSYFFMVDWSLYSVTWCRQESHDYSLHHVTINLELLNKQRFAFKRNFSIYFFPKMLCSIIASVGVFASWTGLRFLRTVRLSMNKNMVSTFDARCLVNLEIKLIEVYKMWKKNEQLLYKWTVLSWY